MVSASVQGRQHHNQRPEKIRENKRLDAMRGTIGGKARQRAKLLDVFDDGGFLKGS